LTENVNVIGDGPATNAPVGERVSQLLFVQVCIETWAVALVLLGAVTVSICDAGGAAPAIALKV
jgi:hypothetical protein